MEIEFDPDKEALNRVRHKMASEARRPSSTASGSTMRTTAKIMARRDS
jgi:hypothetical protein